MTWRIPIMLRASLLLHCIYGCATLCLGELNYALGMAATEMQTSLDRLTRAGEVYPASFTFRTAQAKQLFELSRRYEGITGAAVESLRLALTVDPNSAELASQLLAGQRALGRCDEAKITAGRLARLAPQSDVVKGIVALPCP